MFDVIRSMDPGEFIGFVAVAGGLSIAVVSIVSYHWRRFKESELEAGLKQEMLDRGMSADEIAEVIRATHSKRCEHLHAKLHRRETAMHT